MPLEELIKRFQQVAAKLPRIVGNEVVNFTLENFKRQGFLGANFQPWPKRKNPNKWGTKPKRNNRAILVDTGKMRRATRIAEATWEQVKISNNDPKAKVHNEGFKGSVHQPVSSYTRTIKTVQKIKGLKSKQTKTEVFVTGHNRKIKQTIPQRKFLGDSPYLRRNIETAINLAIMKALKP